MRFRIFVLIGLLLAPLSFSFALININTASVDELDDLPGVGATTSLKIIAYREAYGPFSSIEDLRNVSGFGGEGKKF